MINKRGQVTIFIIIAIVIVAAVAVYFIFRSGAIQGNIPVNLEPAYTSFLACLEQDTETGIGILEAQGGWIQLPEFEPGSDFMPFSSQLNFLGNPIPYWYYVSGNNIQKEQMPSKSEMEEQIAQYVSEKINDCQLNAYYEQGFEISWTEPEAKVAINENNVEVTMKTNLAITRGTDSAVIRNHNVEAQSKIGSLYDSARKVYDEEQKNLFLEEYAIDTLRLYAPVDGVEITCSPKIWNAEDVFDDLQGAIEANTLALNSQIDSDDYFAVNLNVPINHELRFLNSRNWPSSFEVNPASSAFLIANPVGNQQGLGILGFCYVPYHFVYDVKYPILVQISEGEETFQFPVAVVIQGNNPRVALNATAALDSVPEFCAYKNTEVQVNTKDRRGLPVQSEVSYECLGNKCTIGETDKSGVLAGDFPQCANGYVVASAFGFRNARYLFSTINAGSVDVILDKSYSKNVQLKLDGVNYNGNAIVTFTSSDTSKTIPYPEQRTVELGEGQYEIQVYIYRNSSIQIGATTAQECIDVPRSGLLGIVGLQQEKCFDIQVPEQVISQALAGGGKQDYYLLESELAQASTIEINAQSLPTPETIEKLQNNYALFEEKGLDISFV